MILDVTILNEGKEKRDKTTNLGEMFPKFSRFFLFSEMAFVIQLGGKNSVQCCMLFRL